MVAENGSVIAVYIAETPVYKLGVGMCLYIVVYFWYMPTAWPQVSLASTSKVFKGVWGNSLSPVLCIHIIIELSISQQRFHCVCNTLGDFSGLWVHLAIEIGWLSYYGLLDFCRIRTASWRHRLNTRTCNYRDKDSCECPVIGISDTVVSVQLQG